MKRLLVLSTWFPFPLRQGSKIRAYHLIKALARENEVSLISFADEDIDPAWIAHMKQFCTSVQVVHRNPFVKSRFKSLLGWFSPLPSALYAGYSVEMENCVKHTCADWNPDAILALTVITSAYALKVKGPKRVLDIDNVLSRFLHEEYERCSGGIRRVRSWAAWKKFQRFEKSTFNQFDLCLNVSEDDRWWVAKNFKISEQKLLVVPNGVAVEPEKDNLFTPEAGSLVYNGSLAYQANMDAMVFFAGEIWPLILQQQPGCKLRITGRLDGVDISWLPKDGSIITTGYVEDIRRVVAQSWACVVPLRAGAGTRLKVLEAMAVGTPVVSTRKGVEGLDLVDGQHLLVGDTPVDFAQQTVRLLTDAALRRALAENAQKLVREKYNWIDIERKFSSAIDRL